MALVITFSSCLLSIAYAEEDSIPGEEYDDENLSNIRFIELRDKLQEEKLQRGDVTEDSRILKVIKKFKEKARDVSPVVFKEDSINTIQASGSANYWQAGTGRSYDLKDFEVHFFVYGEQMWNEVTDYGLLQQRSQPCNDSPDGCITAQSFSDLQYTMSTFGLGGTLYYYRTSSFAIGIEVPLFATHQLKISSKKAGKDYRINGLSLLGIPIWRHSIITPVKLRYRPSDWFGITMGIKFTSMTIYQQGGKEYDSETEGDWIENCDSNECSIKDYTGNFGLEIIF